MKFLYAALMAFGAVAHDFTLCTDKDHLAIKSVVLTPDPPVIGKVVNFELDGTIDQDATSGTAHMELSAFGVVVDKKDYDLCKVVTCPIKSGTAFKGTVQYTVPSAVPAGIAGKVEITITTGAGVKLSCLDMKIKAVKALEYDPTAPASHPDDVMAINAVQDSWIAHESPRFYNKTLADVAMLCGTFQTDHPDYKPLPPKEGSNYENIAASLPTTFDARTQWSKCPSIGLIRDQSACGSCWAFGSTEAFNDRRCIKTGDTTLLSPEDTNSCSDAGNGCNGGFPGQAWDWFTQSGVVTGGNFGDEKTCLPYSMKPCAHHVKSSKYPACPSEEYPTPRCTKKCSVSSYSKSYSSDKNVASKAYSLDGVAKIQTDLMNNGPVTGAFTVYADFPSYKSGVYKHTSGGVLGGHAIKIMGWGTENGQDYWLVANSWNESWGDNGTFKIARGTDECGIESQISAGLA